MKKRIKVYKPRINKWRWDPSIGKYRARVYPGEIPMIIQIVEKPTLH